MKHTILLIVFLGCVAVPGRAQWVQSNLGSAQVGYHLYADEAGAWAATLNGVYFTDANGNPWLQQGLASRLVFDVVRSGRYLLAATEGTGPGVYRSSDNGVNWLPVTGLTDKSVRALTKNSSYLFASTWGGGVFRSGDSGATWQSLGLVNRTFRSIRAIGETIFAGGDSVFFSANNGASWTARALPWPAADTWCFASFKGAIYAGDMGLYRSTDAGLSWTLAAGLTFDTAGMPIQTTIVHDLAVYNGTLIAAMSPGGIMISSNGTDWQPWIEGGIQSDWTFAGLAVRPPYIWALRQFFGNAYYRPLTDIATEISEDVDHPTGVILHQNYPNPFNPNSDIRYQISDIRIVRITVHDILGREVAVLVNEKKNPGSYTVRFDGSGLASGVYLCRMVAGSFVETRKMLLVR